MSTVLPATPWLGAVTALTDPRRLAGNLIQLGTIDHVDLAAATCRVRVDEIETGDLPWLAAPADASRIRSAPSVGEQCLPLCPAGDMEGGVVLLGLFSDANSATGNAALNLIRFNDGAELSYGAAGAGLKLTLPGGRPLMIVASAGVTLTGPVKVNLSRPAGSRTARIPFPHQPSPQSIGAGSGAGDPGRNGAHRARAWRRTSSELPR